jgi:hypothetical protein
MENAVHAASQRHPIESREIIGPFSPLGRCIQAGFAETDSSAAPLPEKIASRGRLVKKSEVTESIGKNGDDLSSGAAAAIRLPAAIRHKRQQSSECV